MMRRFSAGFRVSISALALVSVLSLAPLAVASPYYPEAVQSALNTPELDDCAIQCQLCHLGPEGGPFNLNRRFGVLFRLQLAGAQPAESVAPALAVLDQPTCVTGTPPDGKCDSDGDGMPDIDELRLGRDPNVEGEGNLCGGPRYGCGARVARGSADVDWVSLLIAGAAAAFMIGRVKRSTRAG